MHTASFSRNPLGRSALCFWNALNFGFHYKVFQHFHIGFKLVHEKKKLRWSVPLKKKGPRMWALLPARFQLCAIRSCIRNTLKPLRRISMILRCYSSLERDLFLREILSGWHLEGKLEAQSPLHYVSVLWRSGVPRSHTCLTCRSTLRRFWQCLPRSTSHFYGLPVAGCRPTASSSFYFRHWMRWSCDASQPNCSEQTHWQMDDWCQLLPPMPGRNLTMEKKELCHYLLTTCDHGSVNTRPWCF